MLMTLPMTFCMTRHVPRPLGSREQAVAALSYGPLCGPLVATWPSSYMKTKAEISIGKEHQGFIWVGVRIYPKTLLQSLGALSATSKNGPRATCRLGLPTGLLSSTFLPHEGPEHP